ncbi:patatin-like phospholipase family protein [Ralstonia holmesii]|uniref:patatin-like phospholipase family protein n=1 Tax=Ralstonia TaxID=48736 RepID=UPI0009B8BFE5|nr:patatin-like phospholipase family protein [Ralstonia pickettii]
MQHKSIIENLIRVFVLSWIVILSACGILPRYEGNAHINSQVNDEAVPVPRARFPSMQACVIALKDDPCFHPMFIGVAISGGGARAANFGLGVAAQLMNLGIYDRVTAISSVSGGSLAAAAISMKPPENNEEFNSLADHFRTDFLSSWMIHSLYPVNLISSVATSRNATRTLADVFDEEIFHGATYGDLGKIGPGRPFLYINGSLTNRVSSSQELTTRGLNSPNDNLQGFTFTERAFREMGSDLSRLRIADAVAASGAYPGLFEPLALKNFNAGKTVYKLPGSEFLHVSDGGASDNLGVDALVRAYSEAVMGSQSMSCLLILVDAHVADQGDSRGSKADNRDGLMDYIVSPSLSRAFDLLLDRRRDDQLERLGIQIAEDHPHRFNPDVSIPLRNYKFLGNGYAATRGRSLREVHEYLGDGGVRVENANCAVWHVALDRLLDLTEKGGRRRREAFYYEHSVDQYRNESSRDKDLIRLDHFVNAIETNYKLKLNGPGGCSGKRLQNSLFEAARVLVMDDTDSLGRLSAWLMEHHRVELAQNITAALKEENGNSHNDAIYTPSYSIHPPDWRSPMASWVDCVE